MLEFDGVFQNSKVWFKGQYLGLRPYGFAPFSCELTLHLNLGGDNLVAVRVDNSKQTNCRWYTGSGDYRHTWLLTTNQLRITYWGAYVTSPHVSVESAVVEVKTRIVNGRKSSSSFTLITTCSTRTGIASRVPMGVSYTSTARPASSTLERIVYRYGWTGDQRLGFETGPMHINVHGLLYAMGTK